MRVLRTSLVPRDPGPVILDGIRARTFEAALSALDQNITDARCVVADLSLGAWRSHLVANEFYAQLGLGQLSPAPTFMADPSGRTRWPPSHAMSMWLDAESGGDRTVLTALGQAAQVVASVSNGPPLTMMIITPHSGLSWETENLLFIRFLAQGLRGRASRLVLLCFDVEGLSIPGDWIIHWHTVSDSFPQVNSKGLLSLIPGVIEPDVMKAIEEAEQSGGVNLIPLANRHLLVAPECRRHPADVSQFEYDRLAAVVRRFDWLKAYVQFFSDNLYVDPLFLAGEALKRFVEGGYGIALRLIERAISCAGRLKEQTICQVQAQVLCLALHKFEEAAAAPDPSPALPREARRFLLMAKGWGLVMLDDPRADSYLGEARALLDKEPGDPESFAVLNISALSLLKSGRLEEALAVEKDIEAGLAEQQARNWHLEYINSLNLARLYRRQGHFRLAEYYYQRAFETATSVRSESDSLYFNACLGWMYTQQDLLKDAFLSWLRACLHWIVSTAPEALSPRVASSILHRRLGSTFAPEEVSAALTSLLRTSAEMAGLQISDSIATGQDLNIPPSPVFIRLDQLLAENDYSEINCAIGSAGWGILATQTAVVPPFASPYHDRLRSLLFELLKLMCHTDELENVRTIAIDDRFGREIPATACELLETCIRLQIPKMVFSSEVVYLDRDLQDQFEPELRICLSMAVDRIEFNEDKGLVIFKRYLTPRVLSMEEAQILASIDAQPSLRELAEHLQQQGSLNHTLKLARSLEEARIVNLYLPQYICMKIGHFKSF